MVDKFNLPTNVSGTIDPQSECHVLWDPISMDNFTNNELVYVSKMIGNNSKMYCYKIEFLERWFHTKEELINPLTNVIFPHAIVMKRVKITRKHSNALKSASFQESFFVSNI